ncbi:MAG: hypothetical protein IK045_04155 [Bacteroidales bacterium]|nr:hypothetical protein [Bacteroidales bacterium]
MKQILFETRQKAEELLKEAQAVWHQSDRSDDLENLGDDPVFSMLLTALAYQSNEFDSEIERLKSEVLEDFARLLVPYTAAHAVPATAVVETSLQDGVDELPVGEDTTFMLAGQHPFMPLMETRALGVEIRSISRLDGRRWKVSLHFKNQVSDLSHFSFAVKGLNFKDLSVSIKGQLLPLVKPWHYANLPLVPCFSPESLTYNAGQICSVSVLPMDLFARQNVRMFFVDRHNPGSFFPPETENLDLVFEFSGIFDDFHFDADNLALNTVMLVNAKKNEVTISSENPVARLVGGQNDETVTDLSSREFLHLVRPADAQIFGDMALEVRGVAGDRFNQGSLVRLLNCIVTKYRSDFYAFQQLRGVSTDTAIFQLESALAELKKDSNRDVLRNVSGVYLMPRGSVKQLKEFSLEVNYLTTAGASVNSLLSTPCSFSAPSGFSSDIRLVGQPMLGSDEIKDEAALGELMRYYLLTGDRVVTMADMKAFCAMELKVRYGIEDKLIRRMSVHKRLEREEGGCGYEIVVDICLVANSFIKRSFTEKLPMAELLLRKMLEVRNAGIYPIKVNITIEE